MSLPTNTSSQPVGRASPVPPSAKRCFCTVPGLHGSTENWETLPPQRLPCFWGAFTQTSQFAHPPHCPEGPVTEGRSHAVTGQGPCQVSAETLTEASAFPSASPELPAVVPLLPVKRGQGRHCQGARDPQSAHTRPSLRLEFLSLIALLENSTDTQLRAAWTKGHVPQQLSWACTNVFIKLLG